MINKSVAKVLGSPNMDGQFAKKSAGTSRPAVASIKCVNNGRLGYGVNGVGGPTGKGGKGTSQLAKTVVGRRSGPIDNR